MYEYWFLYKNLIRNNGIFIIMNGNNLVKRSENGSLDCVNTTVRQNANFCWENERISTFLKNRQRIIEFLGHANKKQGKQIKLW